MNDQRNKPPPLPPASIGFCTVHPHNNAYGRCRRCQQPFCDVCESRWAKEPICLACLNKIIDSNEPTPGEKKTQDRQGRNSLVLAVIGWILFVCCCVLFWTISQGRGSQELAMLDASLFFASFLPALLGLGQAAATIRSRGPRLTMATWSLVLISLQFGVAFTLIIINITHNY